MAKFRKKKGSGAQTRALAEIADGLMTTTGARGAAALAADARREGFDAIGRPDILRAGLVTREHGVTAPHRRLGVHPGPVGKRPDVSGVLDKPIEFGQSGRPQISFIPRGNRAGCGSLSCSRE